MAATANQVNAAAVNAALDQEFVANFRQQYDRLAEILGLFGVTTKAAGTTLKQFTVTGELNNAKTDDSSSGTAYVEGDLVALSKYTLTPKPVGEMKLVPYRKQTTGQAIIENGYEPAVLREDAKMLNHVRSQCIGDFFTFLGNGTGKATGKNLQAVLAASEAALGDALENNGDASARVIHFLNRGDVYKMLGDKDITTQTVFGMNYFQAFLGITDVFTSAKVPSGTVYTMPVENVHAFGLDFGSLSQAGIDYTTDASGIIGVSHTPAMDHVSVDTNVACGLTLVPEITDYIIKGTVAPGA